MFKNYFLAALRAIARYRFFSFINVLGLAIGLAGCILIALYVIDELSYDRYHENAENIYRAGLDGKIGDREMMTYTSAAPFARTMVQEFPEVISACRFYELGNKKIKYEDRIFLESDLMMADSTVFEIFSWNLLHGNKREALRKPNTIVMTTSMARKYFGDSDPIGEMLEYDDRLSLTVTGIMEDVPDNSHFHFDALVSMETSPQSRSNHWLSDRYMCYLLLRDDASGSALEEKLHNFVLKYVGPQLEAGIGMSMEEWLESDNRYGYYLEPLTGIYLDSEATMEIEPLGSKKMVMVFSMVALFILFIACINFMNLTTAKSSVRAKEVGVRKVLGGTRNQLILQFLSEAVVLSFIALFMALLFVHLLLPYFNNLTQKSLALPYLTSSWFLPALVALSIFTGLLAGSYTAFSFASFGVVTVLKSSLSKKGKGKWLRSGLVVFQFGVSIVVIIATFYVYYQINYIQNKDLGFKKEHVIVLKRPKALGNQLESFKQELEKIPSVKLAAASSEVPGTGFSGNIFQREGASSSEMIHFQTLTSDYEFPQVMGLEMKAGRFFSKEFPGDTMSVVVNESAVAALGYDDPLGKNLVGYSGGQEVIAYKIIGVVKDFHSGSLKEQIPNIVFFYPGKYTPSYMAISIVPGNKAAVLRTIRAKWEEFIPGQVFGYFYMDDYYNDLHKNEIRSGKILGVFALLSLFIALLGLFGLSLFISEQRTKEIGVRKVMGAKTNQIVLLLNKQFTLWILLANLIAWPLAWYFVSRWMENFAYHVSLGAWIFILTAFISVAFGWLTVSYQSIKAAVVKPAKSLRYE